MTKTEIKLWLLAFILIVINALYLTYNIRESQKIIIYHLTPNTLPTSQNKPIKVYVEWVNSQLGLKKGYLIRLIQCESSWNDKAVSRTGKYKGAWQISSIHNVPDSCRLDFFCSTNWALNKIKRERSLNAWECSKIIK